MSFMKNLRRTINNGSSRAIALTGNIYDLFWDEEAKDYVPLIKFLNSKFKANPTDSQKGITQIVYELNKNIEVRTGDSKELNSAWGHRVHGDSSKTEKLSERMEQSNSKTPFALELMRQIFETMRDFKNRKNNLISIIESADLLVAEKEVKSMTLNERKRVAILHDWFCDPEFTNGGDTVIMLAESLHGIHSRIARLPQVVSIEISLPSIEERKHFLKFFSEKIKFKIDDIDSVAEQTAGLAIQALRQLLLSRDISPENMAKKVEAYMESQLGEGVVEFKRPTHDIDDCKGHSKVKTFAENVLLPGFENGSIGGAAFGGPIGGGKTFICEAIARRFKGPVIVLKNIRSKWFGETDAIFERLRRLLESFHRIVIFVDEADTQFGGVGENSHPTERRLTGKIQAMMSDVALKGRVIWFLMTARIWLLSPDIRREGRMDLIVPVLDPEGSDRGEFMNWLLDKFDNSDEQYESFRNKVNQITLGYSAGQFANLRKLTRECDTYDQFLDIAYDIIPSDVADTRLYQTLQAKLNCTRASLIFDEDDLESIREDRSLLKSKKDKWRLQISQLESKGVNGT